MPVVFLPEAAAHIDAIEEYVAKHGSPEIAYRLVERLKARCRHIGDLPFGGTPRSSIESGLRSVPFEQAATIFYRVAADAVTIAAVLYRGRDAGKYFRSRA